MVKQNFGKRFNNFWRAGLLTSGCWRVCLVGWLARAPDWAAFVACFERIHTLVELGRFLFFGADSIVWDLTHHKNRRRGRTTTRSTKLGTNFFWNLSVYISSPSRIGGPSLTHSYPSKADVMWLEVNYWKMEKFMAVFITQINTSHNNTHTRAHTCWSERTIVDCHGNMLPSLHKSCVSRSLWPCWKRQRWMINLWLLLHP